MNIKSIIPYFYFVDFSNHVVWLHELQVEKNINKMCSVTYSPFNLRLGFTKYSIKTTQQYNEFARKVTQSYLVFYFFQIVSQGMTQYK